MAKLLDCYFLPQVTRCGWLSSKAKPSPYAKRAAVRSRASATTFPSFISFILFISSIHFIILIFLRFYWQKIDIQLPSQYILQIKGRIFINGHINQYSLIYEGR